jgi:eukaryotic-like serine/threonine-protein kinase
MIGTTLGHYKVTEQIGAGGMGVVYKSRDLHLDRFVALKILPPKKVADPERKRRFVQEAKAASALNHPNIVHVYDIDQADGTDFIAMEYVDGKTLDQLIPRKGMRLNEVLKCAAQIADALAAAHAAGIVHRDLKPANVMVSDNGLVKVLDFGLAKLTESGESDEFLATETAQPHTEEGTIVGTVAYMSPEQAEAKKVDARSDIFSLGSVLYEMVTGQKAFQGATKLSTLSAILHQEPKPVSGIMPAIPADLEKLINRCLRKDAQRRWQNMADVKVALDELKEDSDSGRLQATPARARQFTPVRLVVMAVALAVLAAAGWYWLGRHRRAEPEAPLTALPLTSYPGFEDSPSFSPDGTQVAFQWCTEGPSGNCDIYVKQIGVEPPFRLTTDPAGDLGPAWSPDGRFIAFVRQLSATRVALMIIPQRGGQERVLGECDVTQLPELWKPYVTWTPDSKGIALPWAESAKAGGGLYLISVETGEKRKLTDNGRDTAPAFSPGGDFLAFARAVVGWGADLHLLRLGEGYKPHGEPEKVPSENRYSLGVAWTPDGRDIVACDGFWNGGLWRMAASMSGRPVRLAFASDAGCVPAISRQGNRLAYAVEKFDTNIYGVDLSGPGLNPGIPFKLISSTRMEFCPAYSPDGKRIVFCSDRSGAWEFWVCDRDGSNAIPLTSLGGEDNDRATWSPDGRSIAFGLLVGGQRHIYVINANGGIPRSLMTEHAGNSTWPYWSRDGRWIYFRSVRTGSSGIWKMPAAGGEAVQITPDGSEGDLPQESPDGKYLYYVKGDRYPEQCSVWRIPTSGGEETRVLDSTSCDSPFVVSEQGIYFVTPRDKRNRNDISHYDFSSRATRKIVPVEEAAGFAVSPDGRTILWTQFDQSGSDLMLVENFR